MPEFDNNIRKKQIMPYTGNHFVLAMNFLKMPMITLEAPLFFLLVICLKGAEQLELEIELLLKIRS